MKIKKWNGSAWIQDYPEVNVSSIVATGTPSSTTFLRGDGTWATPTDVDTNNYLTGVSGSGNGTVTFTRQGLSNLTWDASHTHSISFFNSAITSNLDTLFGNGQFGFANTTTGRPEDYGQGINIVNTGTAYNGTDNWITQLAFGTAGSTSYFRTKVNTGAWTAWRKIWNDANDGAGSGLDADLLDGQHGSYFLDTSGSTQTKSGSLNVSATMTAGTATARMFTQSANGVPTNNLGGPTVTEMALFDEQFYNQTAFYDITKLKFYTSTNGSTWTEVTSISDANKRALVGGDSGSSIVIPNLTPYYRIEITNNGNYVFLNALYMYWSSNSHSTTVKIRARRRSDETFIQITNSTSTVSSWPGHLYLPFPTIPFLTGGTSSGHYDIVQIDFQPTWAGGAYSTTDINLIKLQIWGGYPAGKRNIYSTDENKNVAFPAALTGLRLVSTMATGTSPLLVTSTTVNTNLNADLLDGLHSSSFFRVDGTYPNTNMNTIVEGYWHVESTAANVPIAQYGHRWDYDHLNNGQWAAQFYSATSDTDSLWFRQIRNYVAQPWQKLWSSTNDGTGSGLDADLLDGNHASAFLLTTARNEANGVAPLDATSKVPVANLPDFITGAGRGFYLVGTISGAVSLSDASTGLVAQLVALSGGDYENMYGYMWTAAANVTLTWTDQTTLGPTFQYHVLTPGDEGDSTSPVTLEAGDMIVFTKYSDTAGDGNDQQFTFSVINSSDPRFANYLPLTGGTMTGTITSHRSDGQTHNTWALVSEPGNYYLDLNTVVTASNVRWNFNQRNAGTNYNNVLVIDTGKIGIGTSSPVTALDVNGAINTNNNISWANGNADINGQDTNLKFRTWTGSALTEKMRITGAGNVGIKTTSPATTLSVTGTGANGIQLATTSDDSSLSQRLFFTNSTSTNTIVKETTALQFRTGGNIGVSSGTIRMVLLDDGNVGIGTTTPAVKLHVVGGTRITGQLNVMGDAETKRVWVDYEDGNDMGTIQVVQDGVAYKNLALQPDGNNVGIGTRSPSHKLHVNSSNGILTTFSGASSSVQIGADANGGVIRPQTVDRLNFTQANGTNVMTINAGNVGIGRTDPQDLLNIHNSSANANIGLKITRGSQTHGLRLGVNDSHAFLWTSESQDLAFANNDTQRMTIKNSTGNVGIGTTSPGEKLEVNGVAKATSFTSTVATGTAPISVTSTTLATNLNADLLDGYHASSFVLGSSMINYAPLASPAFTGTPTAPTATAGTNTTQLATTAFVSTAVANLINSAPGALDTLDELAAALGDDANFATTVTNSLAGKLSLSGGTMTLSSGTTSNGIFFNTAQTFTGPQIRGKVQELYRDYYLSSYKIWDEGNDGAGSTLDADLLDGNHASAFALASHTHAATDITSGIVATARLGTGTANTTTFLRGDNTWSTSGIATYSTATLYVKRIWSRTLTGGTWTSRYNAGTGAGTAISTTSTFTTIALGYTPASTDQFMIEFSNNTSDSLEKGICIVGGGTFSSTAGMSVISYDAYETVDASQLKIAKYYAQWYVTGTSLGFRYGSKMTW